MLYTEKDFFNIEILEKENINITHVLHSEVKELQSISRETFAASYSAFNTPENMKLYMDTKFSIENLLSELENKNSAFYFLRLENTIAGYLKLNSEAALTHSNTDHCLEIERIYILQKYQGKQLGKLLLDKAIEIAKNAGMEYIWLGVWEGNHRAIEFYERNGFKKYGTLDFLFGTDEQTDIEMRLGVNS